MLRAYAPSILLLISVAGCGGDDDRRPPGTLDAGRLMDAGRATDAGRPADAGRVDDGGATTDAGSVDGGIDAGRGMDSGTFDAGAVVPCPSESSARDLAAASDHTCAIRADGRLFCWGANDHGQIALGITGTETPMAVGSATDWDSVSAGVDYTCATRAGSLYCWGHNMYGRLGVGDTTERDAPIRVGTATDWLSVSVGAYHACGIRTGNDLYCWGHNAGGRLGLGDTMDRWTPTEVGAGTDWASVSPGGSHTCALDTSGTVWCWGGNSDGQLGLGDAALGTDHRTPTMVSPAAVWNDVSTGSSHSCGVRDDGTLWCWGSNGIGQLGLGAGSAPRAASPTRVGGDSNWSTVKGGALRTCADRTDGTLWCWGSNGGALGIGDDARRDAPVPVLAPPGWITYAGGSGHTCGLSTGGTLWCWGRNRDGQLGLGDTTDRDRPAMFCLAGP